MFARISRGWELTKQSWNVLRTDKQLLLFPALSSLACVLVAASFIIPAVVMIDFSKIGAQGPGHSNAAQTVQHNPVYYIWLFAFYFVNYFVIAFFNTALVACAMNRFNGDDTSVKAGLSLAMKRLPQILGWTLVNATVGVVLRMISERSGFLGKIVIGLVGMIWSIASYFVVPILVVEGLGPVAAVKRSTDLIKKTWGESLAANVTVSAISLVVFLVALLPMIAGIGISVATQTWGPAVIGAAVMIVLMIASSLIMSALHMIVLAATYRYAATGLIPEQFEGDLLKQAFRMK